jgi:hypothetical protein
MTNVKKWWSKRTGPENFTCLRFALQLEESLSYDFLCLSFVDIWNLNFAKDPTTTFHIPSPKKIDHLLKFHDFSAVSIGANMRQ